MSAAQARWFSYELDRANAPWIFCAGESFRTIASLELLTTLLCVETLVGEASDWDPELTFCTSEASVQATSLIAGETDNHSNTYIVAKQMSTRFPLCVVVMELAYELGLRGQELQLQWVPREQNLEADELSNGNAARFSEVNRVQKRVDEIALNVLPDMMEFGESSFLDIESRKNARGPKVRGSRHQHLGKSGLRAAGSKPRTHGEKCNRIPSSVSLAQLDVRMKGCMTAARTVQQSHARPPASGHGTEKFLDDCPIIKNWYAHARLC